MAGGPGQPKACARHRALASKPVHSHARSVHPRARSVRKRARGAHQRARSSRRRVQSFSRSAWNSLALPFQCHERGGQISTRWTNRHTLNAVLTKTWPYDGKCRAACGRRPSGTRLRENTNGLVAGAHEEERMAAFGNANKSDPVACRSVISSVVITPPTLAYVGRRPLWIVRPMKERPCSPDGLKCPKATAPQRSQGRRSSG